MHEQGLAHLDIKPANILLDDDSAPQCAVVADLGLARQVSQSGQSALPADAVGWGTPYYAPPEQLYESITTLRLRADVFALGLVALKMLTGAPISAISGLVRAGRSVLVTSLIPATLSELLDRCVCLSPVDRPTMAEVHAALVAAAAAAE
jgi:serine/threonine protein kinase